MASSITQTQTGAAPATPAVARSARRQYLAYGLLAVAFIVLGVLLLAANLGILQPAASRAVQLGWPVVLILAGLALAIWGRTVRQTPLPTFAVERGHYQCGVLRAATGQADLQVRAFGGSSQLAVGCFPGQRGPAFSTADDEACLVMDARLAPPHWPGAWSVALAKGLPWHLDLRSSVGDFDLDLRGLTVMALGVRSTLGRLDLTLPASGWLDAEVWLTFGDVVVRVPDEAELRLYVQAGPLTRVRCDERRLVRIAPGEWTTPLYAASAQRCRLTLHLGAGDLQVVCRPGDAP